MNNIHETKEKKKYENKEMKNCEKIENPPLFPFSLFQKKRRKKTRKIENPKIPKKEMKGQMLKKCSE